MNTIPRLVLGALVVALAAWAADEFNGAAALAVLALGGLLALHLRDRDRIDALEARLDALERDRAARPEPALPTASVPTAPVPTAEERSALWGGRSSAPRPAGGAAPPARKRPRPTVSLDSLPEPLRRAWDFATGGNLLARVGLLVLFVGVGLLIRYAVEQGVISVGLRLAFSAGVGVTLVGLGWRLRRGTPGFGLTLQGGGVAVLYLTVYAAYALYGVVASPVAIVLMGLVAVACGGLAVLQNAPGLAVLGVSGGFAAPVLAGTAEGSHVLLLSYYALLNLGVLGVAWAKGWRSVAVVGFVSTFVTGGLWGGLAYEPALYATVQPFVVLNFAIYLALAVRFALRSVRVESPERALAVDGALVFGLPAATFVLQAGIVEGVVPYGRAWSAAALAAVYLVGFIVLRRRGDVRLLADAFLAVGLTFATLALPLAFQRVVFGAMWVLEGAGLVWVGVRQGKRWMRVGGLALQAIAASVLFVEGWAHWFDTFTTDSLTGWIVAVALGLSAYVLRGSGHPGMPAADDDRQSGAALAAWERSAGRLLLGFALVWWTMTALVHVLDLTDERHMLAGLLGASAVSGALFLGLGRTLRWRALTLASFGLVPVTWLLWALAVATETAPLAAWRWAGWVAVAVVIGASLRVERAHPLRAVAFVGAVWLAPAVLGWMLSWGIDRQLSDQWALGAVGAVLAAALAASVRMPEAAASARVRWIAAFGLALAASAYVVASWDQRGSAAPLPTLPVLNPLGLPTLAVLFGLAALRRTAPAEAHRPLAVLVGVLGFGSLTVEVLRGATVAGASEWGLQAAYASSAVQAALAVTWTVLALVLAVWAVRIASRGLWFFGAAVLALVFAKLLLVDLSQAQALIRIGAFLVVGALMLLIAYLAPLPPKLEAAEDGGEPVE